MSQAVMGIHQAAAVPRESSYLMIRNHNDALWKVELHAITFRGEDFSCYRLITADPDRCRTPDLRHQNGGDGKQSLGH